MKRFLVFWIRAYQAGLSPILPASCRYTPSCSEYARQAIELHGPARGGWLAVRRVGRCHPFGGRGYDPVPDTEPGTEWTRDESIPGRG
ncbi:MAG: membrane protein insertion efficiency factor YidD [Gemmatimonadetes bacterium]|nr:membrane protein insertion efficiency factor YidD [Gemmatimonadota bacterium]